MKKPPNKRKKREQLSQIPASRDETTTQNSQTIKFSHRKNYKKFQIKMKKKIRSE